jgi:hypothetical protein
VSGNDLHSALKSHEVGDFTVSGIRFKHVRLQHGKDAFTETLHASPTGWSTCGIQATDYLRYLGFIRRPCQFFQGECYSREILATIKAEQLTNAIGHSLDQFKIGAKSLDECGVHIHQPEGWGYFFGKRSGAARRPVLPDVDGHIGTETKRLKESEDDVFRYVFTWLVTSRMKGWITHLRARHMPLSQEFSAALSFIDGFSQSKECPEFGFESCWWRGEPYVGREHDPLHNNAENAHKSFESLNTHFSPGIQSLLQANAIVEPFGISMLAGGDPRERSPEPSKPIKTGHEYKYDVALTFAGTDRESAESLADGVRRAGFSVFYDDYYREQLWGKDLVAYFDRVYRKESRYCVMFISKEYAERMWCVLERRSALARLAEQGDTYLLPIRVDNTDLDGVPPTIGRVSLQEHSIGHIEELLIKRLQAKA